MAHRTTPQDHPAQDLHAVDGAPAAAPDGAPQSAAAHDGVFARLRRRWSRRPLRYFAGLAALVLGVVILALPAAYVVEMPGPTQDVLGKSDGKDVIQVTGVPVHRDKGRLLLVTVNASGVPGYPVSNAEVLWAWADPHMEVMPQEVMFPAGQSAEEYAKESDEQMASSQDAAVTAGLDYAAKLGVDTKDAKVTMHVDDIGGPSAGMMYALGLVDLLTPGNEANGQVVAGTGTIDAEGKVGSIGGIDLKMIGARRDGATWFLAPAANCSEVVGKVPEGLRDVRVSTLQEAYDALVAIGKGQGASLPQCSASDGK
ncbi:MAG: S16 family serine protease [Bifidobacterium sp.]|nr:S16 family serine protease [Bifidobacterium sp.]